MHDRKNDCCPVNRRVPSRKASTGAGFGPIWRGVDLNCDRQELRSFPEMTAPRTAHERRQDPVRPDHGVRPVDELRAHRATPRRRRLTDAPAAGPDPVDPRRAQGRLRQPTAAARAAGPGFSGQQGAGGAADAGERHPGPPQAALQGDDGLRAWPDR